MLNGYLQYQQQPNQLVAYVFKIDPLFCQSCVDGASKALDALNCPLLKMQANIEQKLIQVIVPNNISPAQIVNTLSGAGITAEQAVINQQNDQSIRLKI